MYYYIVAALPFLDLSLTAETQVDVDGFMAFSRSMLKSGDFALLSAAREGSAAGNRFLDRVQAFERGLASELARNRAQTLGRDAASFATADEARISEQARQIVAMADPFEAEKARMRFTWQFLDELESGHFFDIERLIIHLLKLLILERKYALTEERGTAGYAETYQNITQPLKDAEIGL